MHSSSRDGAEVIWLAVHTTEGIMRAADLRDWTTWPGSSHASSDETGALLTPADGFVPYGLAAWTLRNGNSISENIEQCGWARWTRAEWLSRPKLLDATARWLADRSTARGIPLVRLSAAEIRARKPGVLGHGDYTVATGDGTHTDPGPNYPWDVVLDKARAYAAGQAPQEDEMASADVEKLLAIANATNSAVASMRVAVADPRSGILSRVASLQGQVTGLTQAISQLAGGGGLDAAEIKAVADQAAKAAVAEIGEALSGAADTPA